MMSDRLICLCPPSKIRSKKSLVPQHVLTVLPQLARRPFKLCVEKGEANAWSRLQVASFFSSQIPERQWQKRSSSSAGPPVTGNTCRTCWISNYVHSFHCYSLIVAKPDFWGNLSKKLPKVDKSAIFQLSVKYWFNTYLSYQ